MYDHRYKMERTPVCTLAPSPTNFFGPVFYDTANFLGPKNTANYLGLPCIMSRPFCFLGPKLSEMAPSFPRFLRFSEGSPRIFFVPETSPRELSASPRATEHGGFRGPCFGETRRLRNRKSRQRTDGRQITDDKGRRFHKKEERRKMTEGERRK